MINYNFDDIYDDSNFDDRIFCEALKHRGGAYVQLDKRCYDGPQLVKP